MVPTMNRTLIAAAVTFVLTACGGASPTATEGTDEASSQRARGQATEPVRPRSADHLPPLPASLTRPDPVIPDTTQAAKQRASASLSLRIDASSPDALIASLQRAEQALSPNDLNRLRTALTVVQMMMSRKMAALAVADPNGINLTDEQLLKLAFGEIHNKTVEEVIAYGIRMTPIVAPDATTASAPAGY